MYYKIYYILVKQKKNKNINYCCNDYNEAAENEHMDCLKYLVQK